MSITHTVTGVVVEVCKSLAWVQSVVASPIPKSNQAILTVVSVVVVSDLVVVDLVVLLVVDFVVLLMEIGQSIIT